MLNMSNNKEPTSQQRDVINYSNNIVVMAKPGSGKTYTISEKIKGILKNSLEYQGVIAISYTNKASAELKHRILNLGVNAKSSFFGTMSLFYLVEIIYPFGNHIFGNPSTELEVCGKEDESDEVIKGRKVLQGKDMDNLLLNDIKILATLYVKGFILLETIDALAVYIYKNSLACRRYIKARYTHVVIDEFQDCGKMQYEMFIKLVNDGLTGIAVGDKDQSIYGFSGKSSDYLLRLVANPDFKPFYLDKNFRCHKSISDYSLRLLDHSYPMNDSLEKRIFKRRVSGSEKAIVQYIEKLMPSIKKKYNFHKNSDIAILVPSNSYGDLIACHFTIKHKYFKKTALDEDSSLWATIFKSLLSYIQNRSANIYEFCENYFDVEDDNLMFVKLYKKIEALREKFSTLRLARKVERFKNIAELVYPKADNETAINNLSEVLKDPESIESFTPASDDELQIMTLHKSKGLEFKIVFHLGLYKYILPKEGYDKNNIWNYTEYDQNLNLHYVGVTRAEEACILLTSTKRHNGKGDEKQGVDSEFLSLNGLNNYQA
ncbi:DNA helicase II [Clostridium puniceum]|uniref:DNA 3'-5' helicase n=2 Tax=Clostridium puniceum TaxID=29367 RepID=A0A1S8SZ77_9CLOT|nr:DNA helicase II [Clostridium puniceum]